MTPWFENFTTLVAISFPWLMLMWIILFQFRKKWENWKKTGVMGTVFMLGLIVWGAFIAVGPRGTLPVTEIPTAPESVPVPEGSQLIPQQDRWKSLQDRIDRNKARQDREYKK